MTFEIKRPNWVSDRLVAERGEYAGFQMYTREGNSAVAEMLLRVFDDAEELGRPRDLVIEDVRKGVARVTRRHPEVHDTEPRGTIYDVTDEFFEQQGWTAVTEDLF